MGNLNKDELKTQLDTLGVAYEEDAKKEELEKLLADNQPDEPDDGGDNDDDGKTKPPKSKDDISTTDTVLFVKRTYGWSEKRQAYALVETVKQQSGKSDKDGKPEYETVKRERLLHVDVYEFNTKTQLGEFDKIVFVDGNPKNYLFANLKLSK